MINKKMISIFLILFILSIGFINILADQVHPSRLEDSASTLTSSEKILLISMLDEISTKQNCDIAIVTIDDLDGKTPQQYADDYYDYNNYGLGENKDGILLLISTNSRDWYISTHGFGITAFTDAGINYIGKQISTYLSKNDYCRAFETYANLCDSFINKAKKSNPYDLHNLPKEPLGWIWIPISLTVGILISFLITAAMKSQLKNIKNKYKAVQYVKKNSLDITDKRELFLFSKIDRHAKVPKNSASTVHTSSSGNKHGGGGGKF